MTTKKDETKKTTPNGIQFLEIHDSAIIARMLNVAVAQKIPIVIWLKNQTLKFDTIFASYYQKLQRLFIQLPPEVSEEKFQSAINNQGSAELLGSFQIQTVNFFFKTEFIANTEQKNIQIIIPKEIYKLQRRQNLRIAFNRRTAPKITLFNPSKTFQGTAKIKPEDLLAYRMLDVSAGGLAFAAKIEDKDLFPRGKLLNDLRFSIRGLEIASEAHVTHAAQTMNEVDKPILKIGVKFDKLKIQYEKHIIQFVMDESRKLFSLLN